MEMRPLKSVPSAISLSGLVVEITAEAKISAAGSSTASPLSPSLLTTIPAKVQLSLPSTAGAWA